MSATSSAFGEACIGKKMQAKIANIALNRQLAAENRPDVLDVRLAAVFLDP
jgi:hypothetical protein